MSTKATSRVVMAMCIVAGVVGLARGETIVLALTGQDAPSPDSAWSYPGSMTDPDGLYFTFKYAPVLNSRGQIAFQADLEGTYYGSDTDTAIFRVDSEEGRLIVQKGLHLPSWDGRFESFFRPAINEMGQVAFWAEASTGRTGIYCGTGEAVPTEVVRENEPAPDGNGRFDEMSKFTLPALDMAGNVGFMAHFKDTAGGLDDDLGIVVTSGSVPMLVVREHEAAKLDNPTVYNDVAMSQFGQVAFLASVTGLSGEPVAGIFRGRDSLHSVAQENMAVPDGTAVFSSFGRPSIFELTPYEPPAVVFLAYLKNTTGIDDDIGLFRAWGPYMTEIVRRGDSPPDGNGQYELFAAEVSLALNAIAFRAQMRNTSAPGLDRDGIYRYYHSGDITETIKIARAGDPAPGGNGLLHTLYQPVMNSAGQVAFLATLRDTAGGYADDHAIYIGNGLILVEVARMGNPLLGSTITELYFATGPDCRNGLNAYCQVAYKAVLADGREALVLTTPLVQWIGGTSGGWPDNANWTLDIMPAEVHDVVITPGHSVEVAGPRTDATVKSLTLGTPDGGAATLNLTGGGNLTALEEVVIGADGLILVGAGRTLSSAALLNEGILTLDSGIVQAGELNNKGTLRGLGAITASVMNTGGTIQPGDSPGTLHIYGNYTQDGAATLEIELDGIGPREFDVLAVTGAASLSGTLKLLLGFTPGYGDEFEIMTYASRTGEFGAVLGGNISPNLWFDLDYGPTSLTLDVVPEPTVLSLLAIGVLALIRRKRGK